MTRQSLFNSVVFAGGGSRCFWQLGFWETAAPALGIHPVAAAAVSAGAPFACFALAADAGRVLGYFKKLTAANKKNIYLEHLFRKKPVFPHYAMYRDAVLHILDDAFMARLRQGPDVRVLLTRAPRWMGAYLAAFISVALYNLEKHTIYPLHPVFSKKVGFRGETVLASECRTGDELADLFMQTSCAPPLLPVMKRGRRVVLDGGIIDNVPVFMVDDLPGAKLVLLTRKYRPEMLAGHDNVTFVQPSEEIKIQKWEYSDPEGLQYVYDLGRRDGDAFAAETLMKK
jgi:predicted acylesterase/phospholipase RssA